MGKNCEWCLKKQKQKHKTLDCKEIQPVHSKGDQSWVFFGRNDAKAETPVLWPPHAKNRLIGKDSDAGRDWGQEEKGTAEHEMAGWYHWLDGRESEWTPGVGDGQGGLACCDSWGRKESDTTEPLIWSDLLLCSTDSRAQAQQLWCMGLVAQQHVRSSQTGDQTHLSCIGRWILNKGPPGKSLLN